MWAAMSQDLRSFLDAVKRRAPDGFQVVSRPVDPAYEITALVVKLEKERRKRPILLPCDLLELSRDRGLHRHLRPPPAAP